MHYLNGFINKALSRSYLLIALFVVGPVFGRPWEESCSKFLYGLGNSLFLRKQVQFETLNDPSRLKSVLERVRKYRHTWSQHPLHHAIIHFCGETPEVSIKGAKVRYRNPENGITIIDDPAGLYFRIYDPKKRGRRKFVNWEGKIPSKTNRNKYERMTHFDYSPFVGEASVGQQLTDHAS